MPTIHPTLIDVEVFILGICLRDNHQLPESIVPGDFVEPKHQDIAQAIKLLTDKGVTPDELSVSIALRDGGSNVEAYYVSNLASIVGSVVGMNPSWVHEVKKHAQLRAISNIVSKVKELSNDTGIDPESLIAFTEGSLSQILNGNKRSGPVRMDQDALLDFDRKDDPNTILGNRWLCKGGSCLIVSQAGVGKSSLMMQAAVNWSVGGRKDFFGIKSKKPLRIVIVQAENDFGDVAEAYQDVFAGANLYPDEKLVVKENLAIFRDCTSVGEFFPAMLRELIISHNADLVFVDPLLSFAGIDIANQEQASKFLRHGVNKVLVETQAVMIAMHHTTKPRSAKDKEGQTISDLAYSGAGSSEFVNYFREVAVLARMQGDEPIFKFGLTKRRGRSGMKDVSGDFAGEITIRHSRNRGEIRWEYAMPGEGSQPSSQSPSPAADKPSSRRRAW